MTGTITWVTINERPASEFLIHTYAAATLNVPVVFVSGDKGLCEDVQDFNPYIGTVAVKEGIGNSTVNIHPELATQRIQEGAYKALTGEVRRCLKPLESHFTVEVRYREHSKAYTYGFFPGPG